MKWRRQGKRIAGGTTLAVMLVVLATCSPTQDKRSQQPSTAPATGAANEVQARALTVVCARGMRLASDISEEVRLYDRVEPCVEIVCELKGECLRDAVQCSLPVVTTAHDDRGRTVEFPPVSRETVRIWREHMFFPIREFPMDRLWIPILLDEPRRDARSLSVEGELPVLMAASPKLVTGPLPEEEQELTWPHLKKAEVQCTVSHGPGTHVVLDWTGNFELVRDVQIRTADNVVHKWHGRSGSDPQRVVYTFFVHPEGLKVNLEGAVIEATVGTKFKSTTVPFKLKDVPIPH